MWGASVGALRGSRCNGRRRNAAAGLQVGVFGLHGWPGCVGRFFLLSVLWSDSAHTQRPGVRQAGFKGQSTAAYRPPAQRPSSVTGRGCMFIFLETTQEGIWRAAQTSPLIQQAWAAVRVFWPVCETAPELLELQGKACSRSVWGPQNTLRGAHLFLQFQEIRGFLFGLSQTPRCWGSDPCFLRGLKKSCVFLVFPQSLCFRGFSPISFTIKVSLSGLDHAGTGGNQGHLLPLCNSFWGARMGEDPSLLQERAPS